VLHEQITRPVRNLKLFTVRQPAATPEHLDRSLQVPYLEHRQNGRGGTMAGEQEQGSAANLDRGHTGAHTGEIPDFLGLKCLRIVFAILPYIRASHIEKTQDFKRGLGDI